jgi:AraC-like DNA-binding protein
VQPLSNLIFPMHHSSFSTNYGSHSLAPGLPDGFKGPFLPGATNRHISETLGTIVVQELEGEGFKLAYLIFDFFQRITLTGRHWRGFSSFFSHKGNGKFHINGRSKNVREGRYWLVQTDEERWQVELHPNKPFHFFHTWFSSRQTEDIVTAFPKHAAMLLGKKGTLGAIPADTIIRDTVHQILYAQYEQYQLPFYFKAKVSEYLFLILKGVEHPFYKEPNPSERLAIYQARDIILKDLLKHYTMPHLAKLVNLDKTRLQFFFNQEFGVGPLEFLRLARLDKAIELIEQGYNIKTAAPISGYTISGFHTGFKNRFGYTPGSIERRKLD